MKIAKEPISMETPIGDDDDLPPWRFPLKTNNNTLAPADAAPACLHAWRRQGRARSADTSEVFLVHALCIEMSTDHKDRNRSRQQFDVTRELIRQIEAKALRKLRHPRPDKLRKLPGR
jgi:RNA polymerase primary sigma factor